MKEIVRKDGAARWRSCRPETSWARTARRTCSSASTRSTATATGRLFEALAPDPTRPDALTWIAQLRHHLAHSGRAALRSEAHGRHGSADAVQLVLARTSAPTRPSPTCRRKSARTRPWAPGQTATAISTSSAGDCRRHKYRRLHLNLPGAPDGAFLDVGGDHGDARSPAGDGCHPPGTAMSRSSTCRGGSSR